MKSHQERRLILSEAPPHPERSEDLSKEDRDVADVGKFTLTLPLDSEGRWLIVSGTDNPNSWSVAAGGRLTPCGHVLLDQLFRAIEQLAPARFSVPRHDDPRPGEP
jgi:hypothetical protein